MMNTIGIQIEVNLGEATLSILQKFLQIAPKTTETVSKRNESVSKTPETAPKAAENVPEAPAANDLPVDDMPGPITDEELRAAVKNAKDRTSAADVKAVFAKFGIKTSIECPDERRYELLTALVNLQK